MPSDEDSLEGKLTSIAVVFSNLGHAGMDHNFDGIAFHVVNKYIILSIITQRKT